MLPCSWFWFAMNLLRLYRQVFWVCRTETPGFLANIVNKYCKLYLSDLILGNWWLRGIWGLRYPSRTDWNICSHSSGFLPPISLLIYHYKGRVWYWALLSSRIVHGLLQGTAEKPYPTLHKNSRIFSLENWPNPANTTHMLCATKIMSLNKVAIQSIGI